MAPPTVYRGGTKPVHFLADFSRFKEFRELWDKQGKSYTQRLNELINQDLERNSIGEDIGENISCLGYTPKPVQQKIVDFDNNNEKRFRLPPLDELVKELENLHTPQEVGRLQGEYSRGWDKCKRRMNQVKIANLRV